PWCNDRINEFQYHPMAFNPYAPAPGNRTLPAWNMDALLRHGDTGADAMVSNVRQLLPNSMNNRDSRNLVTTHSCDVDRPGVIPWNDNHTNRLQMASAKGLRMLTGGPTGFPIQPPLGANSEFSGLWQSALATLGRIDLNRPLPDYPPLSK